MEDADIKECAEKYGKKLLNVKSNPNKKVKPIVENRELKLQTFLRSRTPTRSDSHQCEFTAHLFYVRVGLKPR